MISNEIEIYDSTLRDGNQGINITFSLNDKLEIAQRLDEFGVNYIEGGWPNSTSKIDLEFYRKIKKSSITNAKIAAFGSTRLPKLKACDDIGLKSLIEAETEVITIFGKSWDLHVEEVIRTSLAENLEMIESSIAYLKKHTNEVIYDAEHFFDGYKHNPEYALQTLLAAVSGGADTIVLCDTNGGLLPFDFECIFKEVSKKIQVKLGVHIHNDSGCSDVNSLIGVKHGAKHVQGTFNGIGERCGNANLCTIIPNLEIKMGISTACGKNLAQLSHLAKFVSASANIPYNIRQPYVGDAAFSHKGGTHINGVMKVSESFEHVKPEIVGNEQSLILSDQAGSSTILKKLQHFLPNLKRTDPIVSKLLIKIKNLEKEGYQFEAAEGSFRLLAYRMLNLYSDSFHFLGFRVIDEKLENGDIQTEATIKVESGGKLEHTAANGNGPVDAINNAISKALGKFYPELSEVELLDYKVLVINAKAGTGARVRVLIQYSYKISSWGCVGVSENIIEASWKAMIDGINYKLLKERIDPDCL